MVVSCFKITKFLRFSYISELKKKKKKKKKKFHSEKMSYISRNRTF